MDVLIELLHLRWHTLVTVVAEIEVYCIGCLACFGCLLCFSHPFPSIKKWRWWCYWCCRLMMMERVGREGRRRTEERRNELGTDTRDTRYARRVKAYLERKSENSRDADDDASVEGESKWGSFPFLAVPISFYAIVCVFLSADVFLSPFFYFGAKARGTSEGIDRRRTADR